MTPRLAAQVIAVNYQGAVSILARLAPRLAAAGQGAVVVLSSVAGDRGRPSNFVYGSAKAGLNVYLQGLRAGSPIAVSPSPRSRRDSWTRP